MQEYSLCKICTRLLICDRARDHNKKVYYCEDFQKSVKILLSNQVSKSENSSKQKENDMQNGLCRICQNRKDCNIKIPEGGLWHCENFF